MPATSPQHADRDETPPAEPNTPDDQTVLRTAWRKMAASTPGTVLLECTLPAGTVDPDEAGTLLFTHPKAILTARTEWELAGLLTALESALATGSYVAGYLTYEAACLLEGSPARELHAPLAWFGVYAAPVRLGPSDDRQPLPSVQELPLCWELERARAQYLEDVATAQVAIAAGETYQVNLTTAVTSSFRGDVALLYNALAAQQPTSFSALLHPAAGEHILSFSPELLFRTEKNGRILARPMKGTASADRARAALTDKPRLLETDEKNRAEHVMIVDLLRNDLNRVAIPGSVHVDPLFAIEQYETLLQMTSTIAGKLRPGVKLGEILRALLPAGSMTGAPKHHTLEIIHGLEGQPRGVYSGAIGYAAPDGTAVFSVPIRTLVQAQGQLRMGVGSGIVADSQPEDELVECWLKCGFLLRASVPYDLVETFRWDGTKASPAGSSREEIEALLLTRTRPLGHLDRLEHSAHQLGFPFDRTAVWNALVDQAAALPEPHRLRLLLDRKGRVRFDVSPLDLWPDEVRLRVSPERLWPGDSFLRHKTSFRLVYDRELARARTDGFADALFFNERCEIAEGAISSIFLLLDGIWCTPALRVGLLPGVARHRLLQAGYAEERVLTAADLQRATAVSVSNGVRGSAPVRAVELYDGTTLHFSDALRLPQSQPETDPSTEEQPWHPA